VAVGALSLTTARSLGGVIDRVDATGVIRTVAMLGNHMPRQCGIATFTTHLADALAAEFPLIDGFVLAMNDPGRRHAYPSRVRFEIAETDCDSYRRAADFLNVNNVDVLSVQHEYGIFGGKAGSYVLTLLRGLRMPIVTTLHTILAEPNPQQRASMDELVQLSERLVVMSVQGRTLLHTAHGVPLEKIDHIPHGIFDAPARGRSKYQLGVDGRKVLLTFGLLSPDKGIEHVIDALPAILAKHPETVYIVLGATHPHVKEHHGETYRLMLEARARRLGVDGSMIFHNRFVSQGELAEFLAAADIYITPYLKPEQITSGTLAYAVGTGKAVISTPYWYASELLADERGVLVPWRDPQAIAREASALLGDDERRLALGRRAAAYGRDMRWPAVARAYVESFTRAHGDHARRRHSAWEVQTLERRPLDLPVLDLGHLGALTDDTGILQHAIFTVPRYDDGYCLDDNARALLLMTLIEDAGTEEVAAIRLLSSRYLAFVSHAFHAPLGRFRNFMSYSRRWTEECGSEDSHGRALWALGTVVGRSAHPGRNSLGGHLFHAALPATSAFTSPRAWAFTLLGIDEYLRAFGGDTVVQAARTALAERLFELYQRASAKDWPWFEERVTYCNARLSQALVVCGARMGREAMQSAGLRSLDWLFAKQLSAGGDGVGTFTPIGSNGFYQRGEPPARFDQQPVEACAMASACLEAHRLTGERRWAERARVAFNWFVGDNELHAPIYDATSGGCRDGLHAERVNENEGAESTLSFLLALTEMRAADRAEAVMRAGRDQ
jgi:glycosyltransferase involved in cell wall biosynthesis